MLVIHRRITPQPHCDAELELTFEARSKSRLRCFSRSGEDVGLPSGPDGPVMGNSEVGHQNLGAGRIVDQELMRITRAIRDGSFFENPALRAAFERAKHGPGRVHLLGLVSDGQVHSDLPHLLALLEMARREGVPGDRRFALLLGAIRASGLVSRREREAK